MESMGSKLSMFHRVFLLLPTLSCMVQVLRSANSLLPMSLSLMLLTTSPHTCKSINGADKVKYAPDPVITQLALTSNSSTTMCFTWRELLFHSTTLSIPPRAFIFYLALLCFSTSVIQLFLATRLQLTSYLLPIHFVFVTRQPSKPHCFH